MKTISRVLAFALALLMMSPVAMEAAYAASQAGDDLRIQSIGQLDELYALMVNDTANDSLLNDIDGVDFTSDDDGVPDGAASADDQLVHAPPNDRVRMAAPSVASPDTGDTLQSDDWGVELVELEQPDPDVLFRDVEQYRRDHALFSQLTFAQRKQFYELYPIHAGSLETLESMGYSLDDAILYAMVNFRYAIPLDQLIKVAPARSDCLELSRRLFGYYLHLHTFYVGTLFDDMMRDAIVYEGLTYEQAVHYIVANSEQSTKRELAGFYGSMAGQFTAKVLLEVMGVNLPAQYAAGDPDYYGDAPFKKLDHAEESVRLNSGDLTLETTDLVLPGKNGFDFVLGRTYDSSKAAFYEPTFEMKNRNELQKHSFFINVPATQYGGAYTYYFGEYFDTQNDANEESKWEIAWWWENERVRVVRYLVALTNNVEIPVSTRHTNTNIQSAQGLGQGWRFNIPYIYTKVSGQSETMLYRQWSTYLQLSDGRAYQIDTKPSSNSSILVDYPYSDMRLAKESGSLAHSSGSVSYDYVLYFQNGTKQYFSNNKMVAQQDKFGNMIKYAYSTSSNSRPKIVVYDSVGRVITIESVNISGGYAMVVSVDDSKTLRYEMVPTKSNASFYEMHAFVDQEGRKTQYTYNYNSTRFKMFETIATITYSYNGVLGDWDIRDDLQSNTYQTLDQITYPTNGMTKYTYARSTKSYYKGYEEFYRLTSRYDQEVSGSTRQVDKLTFGYSTVGFTGYPSKSAPSSYTTTVTESDGKVTTHTFNSQHLTSQEVATASGTKLTEKNYQYNNQLLTRSSSKTFSGNQTLDQVYLYEYDTKAKLLLKSWTPLAKGLMADREHITEYTYDMSTNGYYLPLSMTYKQDNDTTIRIEYTLTADRKQVAWKKVYVNNGLKEVTQYLYDSYNNIIEERSYHGDLVRLNDYVSTHYSYANTNPDMPSGYNNAFRTSHWVEGVVDVDGQLIDSPFGAGVVQSHYQYDWFGNIIESTNANGYVTTLSFDGLGRALTETFADGTQRRYSYNDSENLFVITDELGTDMWYCYDAFGNLSRIYDPEGQFDVLAYNYDEKSRLVSESTYGENGLKYITSYTYDFLDRVVDKTVTSGGTVYLKDSYMYDDAYLGQYYRVQKTALGDSTGPSTVTATQTDLSGRMVQDSYILGGKEYVNVHTYDYVGNKTASLTALDASKGRTYSNQWQYDHAGHVLSEKNALGYYSHNEYDALGRLIAYADFATTSAGAAHRTTYVYDALGRVLEERKPFEERSDEIVYTHSQYIYNPVGQVVLQRTAASKPGEALAFAEVGSVYDERGRLLETVYYDGGKVESIVQYGYDAVGNVVALYTGLDASRDRGEAAVSTFQYDHLGNVIESIDPLGRVERSTYDRTGLLRSREDRNGNRYVYSYDAIDRETGIVVARPDGKVERIEKAYSQAGYLKSQSNGDTTIQYRYDEVGRPVSVTQGPLQTQYTYDILGQRLSSTVYSGSQALQHLAYGYDALGRLEVVRDAGGHEVGRYGYDANGNRTQLVYENGVKETYTYNLANLVTQITNRGDDLLSSFDYTYYLNGFEATKTDHIGFVTDYEYDGLGRLVKESTPTQSYAYGFDTFGNRVEKVAEGEKSYRTTYRYDANNRLIEDIERTDKTMVITGYTYDANGNLLSQRRDKLALPGSETPSLNLSSNQNFITLYQYNGFGQLVAGYSGGETFEYRYAPDGNRIGKTVNGEVTTHVWDGSNIVADLDGEGVLKSRYTRGIGLLELQSEVGSHNYLFNGRGDVVQLVSAGGDIVAQYDYDAFGNQVEQEKAPASEVINPFRFGGEYHDNETGNIYLRARYYDPIIGRFITEDVARDGYNWYTYCGGNPVVYVDPTGFARVKAIYNSAEYSYTFSVKFDSYGAWMGELAIGIGLSAIPVVGPALGASYTGYTILRDASQSTSAGDDIATTLMDEAGSAGVKAVGNAASLASGFGMVMGNVVKTGTAIVALDGIKEEAMTSYVSDKLGISWTFQGPSRSFQNRQYISEVKQAARSAVDYVTKNFDKYFRVHIGYTASMFDMQYLLATSSDALHFRTYFIDQYTMHHQGDQAAIDAFITMLDSYETTLDEIRRHLTFTFDWSVTRPHF